MRIQCWWRGERRSVGIGGGGCVATSWLVVGLACVWTGRLQSGHWSCTSCGRMRGRKLLSSCAVDRAAAYLGWLLPSVCWCPWCRQGSNYCCKYGDLTWFTGVLFLRGFRPPPTISILYVSAPTVPLWLTPAEIRQPIRIQICLSSCALPRLFSMPKSTSVRWVLDAAVWMVVSPHCSPGSLVFLHLSSVSFLFIQPLFPFLPPSFLSLFHSHCSVVFSSTSPVTLLLSCFSF